MCSLKRCTSLGGSWIWPVSWRHVLWNSSEASSHVGICRNAQHSQFDVILTMLTAQGRGGLWGGMSEDTREQTSWRSFTGWHAPLLDSNYWLDAVADQTHLIHPKISGVSYQSVFWFTIQIIVGLNNKFLHLRERSLDVCNHRGTKIIAHDDYTYIVYTYIYVISQILQSV